MSGLVHYRDHVEQGLERLLWQFRDKPRIRAWTRSYLRQVQDLEDAAWDVLVKRWLDYAEGVQLDVIGRVVGELRKGRDDATYKQFIRARVRINRSQGNTGDILAVFMIVTTTPTLFAQYAPASVFLEMLTIPEYDPVLIYSALFETKAGGVKLALVSPTTNTLQAQARDEADADVEDNSVGDAAEYLAGAAASISDMGGGTMRLAQAGAGFPASLAGKKVRVSASASAANVGTFDVGAVLDADTIEYTNALGVADAGAAVAWNTWSEAHGMLSDAVTVRDPKAEPPVPRPGPPKIFTLTPATGPDEGGTLVTVVGQNFENVSSVRLDPLANGPTNVADLTIVSKTQMTFRTPPRAFGQSIVSKLWVTNIRGTGTKLAAFVYQPAPKFEVTGSTPNSGPFGGGTEITITGDLFDDVVLVELLLAADSGSPLPLGFTVDSTTQITAVTPSGLPYAPYTLRLTNSLGQHATFGSLTHPAFVFAGPPSVVVGSVEPAQGSRMGGYTVTLRRAEGSPPFTEVTDISFLALSSLTTWAVIDDDTIEVTWPNSDDVFVSPWSEIGDSPSGTFAVWIYDTFNGGSPSSMFLWTYDKLAITAMTPNEVPAAGGVEVTIEGFSLDSVLDLLVDGVSTAFTIVDQHTITFTPPAAAIGSVVVHLQGQPDANAPDGVEEVAEAMLTYG